MSELKEKYVTVEEAAELANRKMSLIRVLCREGRFPHAVKMGNAWIIPRNEIEAYQPAKRGVKPRKAKLAAEREEILRQAKGAKEEHA
jgi:predicted DNA-binding transcriptional regulator AlpA